MNFWQTLGAFYAAIMLVVLSLMFIGWCIDKYERKKRMHIFNNFFNNKN